MTVILSTAKDHGHTCGLSAWLCAKVSRGTRTGSMRAPVLTTIQTQMAGFGSALRLPAGDIVNNPWEDSRIPGTVNGFRKIEIKRELALKERQYWASANPAPVSSSYP